MTNQPQRHVFLSHVREDGKRVELLATALRDRGIECWIDRHRIKPGERWERAIEEAIRSGSFFIACFSSAYLKKASSYMNEELYVAGKEVRRRPFNVSWFIPLRFDECQIPDWPIAPELTISSFQWLDMFPDWSRSIERLAETIEASQRSSHTFDALAVFRDEDANWCPELVVVPPGELLLDRSNARKDSDTQTGRARVITIPAHFALGRCPVTFDEYERYVETTHQVAPDDEGFGRGRRPVINIDWKEARGYVEWLSSVTGQTYRLPSEIEWEYACRAGSVTRYSWGDEQPTQAKANFGFNFGKTSEVGSYPPNSFGLFDMHGNVAEWVDDCWSSTMSDEVHSESQEVTATQACEHGVLRGGSWADRPEYLRSHFRLKCDRQLRSYLVGFRVARGLETRV